MATSAPLLIDRAQGLAALLPVRVEDRRFWPRALLGLALRALALELEWSWLRASVSSTVAWSLRGAGVDIELVSRSTLVRAPWAFEVTASCTHVEVVGLLAPLVWDRSRSVAVNGARCLAFAAVVVGLSVARIDLAIALRAAGLPWVVSHDVLLGLGYFVVMASVLAGGAWTRSPSGAAAGWRLGATSRASSGVATSGAGSSGATACPSSSKK